MGSDLRVLANEWTIEDGVMQVRVPVGRSRAEALADAVAAMRRVLAQLELMQETTAKC